VLSYNYWFCKESFDEIYTYETSSIMDLNVSINTISDKKRLVEHKLHSFKSVFFERPYVIWDNNTRLYYAKTIIDFATLYCFKHSKILCQENGYNKPNSRNLNEIYLKF